MSPRGQERSLARTCQLVCRNSEQPGDGILIGALTKASWTAPQKHVAVASSPLDQPSVATPASGI
jgi:hypothetical protein